MTIFLDGFVLPALGILTALIIFNLLEFKLDWIQRLCLVAGISVLAYFIVRIAEKVS